MFAEENRNNHDQLQVLEGLCWDFRVKNEWWTYRWCYKKSVDQLHFHRRGSEPSIHNRISLYEPKMAPNSTVQHFFADVADCVMEDGDFFKRMAKVTISCCLGNKKLNQPRGARADVSHGTYIQRVHEYLTCHYNIDVCSDLLCDPAELEAVAKDVNVEARTLPGNQHTREGHSDGDSRSDIKKQDKVDATAEASPSSLEAESLFQGDVVTKEQQSRLRERVRAM